MENDFESHLVFKKMGYKPEKEQKMNIDWKKFSRWMDESGYGTMADILNRNAVCREAFKHLEEE